VGGRAVGALVDMKEDSRQSEDYRESSVGLNRKFAGILRKVVPKILTELIPVEAEAQLPDQAASGPEVLCDGAHLRAERRGGVVEVRKLVLRASE
jgi:hypothetical protein